MKVLGSIYTDSHTWNSLEGARGRPHSDGAPTAERYAGGVYMHNCAAATRTPEERPFGNIMTETTEIIGGRQA